MSLKFTRLLSGFFSGAALVGVAASATAVPIAAPICESAEWGRECGPTQSSDSPLSQEIPVEEVPVVEGNGTVSDGIYQKGRPLSPKLPISELGISPVGETIQRAFNHDSRNFFNNRSLLRQVNYIFGIGSPIRFLRGSYPENNIARDAETVHILYNEFMGQQVNATTPLRTRDLDSPYQYSLQTGVVDPNSQSDFQPAPAPVPVIQPQPAPAAAPPVRALW